MPPLATRTVVTKALIAACVIVLALLPVILRPISESASYLDEARTLAAADRHTEAVVAYRKSVAWRSPFDGSSIEAARELYDLGHSEKLDLKSRLTSLEELKRGLMSSRSWWWSIEGMWHGPPLELVQSRIDQLLPPPADYVREADPPNVHFGFQALAQVTFWGWIALVLWAIWSGFDSYGRAITRKLTPRLLGALTLFVGWLLALARA